MQTRTKTIFTIALAASFLVIFLLPALFSITSIDFGVVTTAEAQESYRFLEPIPGVGDEIDVDNEFSSFIQTVIAFVIGLTILGAVVMIVAAGFQYMTTTSQDKTSDAKKTIQNAVLGLVLALASVVILQTINPQLIELKSVETVTTSGSMFVIPGMNEFGGAIHAPSDNTHGNKHCVEVEGVLEVDDLWGGGDDNNRFICYQTEESCEENVDEIDRVLNENQAIEEVDRVNGCQYYFESRGRLVQVGEVDEEGNYIEPLETERVLESDMPGVGASKQEALDECEAEVKDFAFEEHVITCYRSPPESTFSSLKCEARCGEPQDKPKPLPDGWNSQEWCSVDDPSANDCFNEKPICESVHGNCYRSPISMVDGNNMDKNTTCDDCVFVNGSDYPLKPASICSPSEQSPGQCRIDGGLATSLTQIEQFLNPPTAPNPLSYEITETFPPTVGHRNSCHYNGTCVDVGLRKDGDEMNPDEIDNRYQNTAADGTEKHAEKINMFIEAAEEYGLRVEYEVGSMELMNRLIDHGVDPNNIADYGVRPHFSVYK